MSVPPATLEAALAGQDPPAQWPVAAQALFWEARGDWARAHALVAEADGRDAAWAHAYLHRCEGDLGNARYWYARAGHPESRASLAEERAAIVAVLLSG